MRRTALLLVVTTILAGCLGGQSEDLMQPGTTLTYVYEDNGTEKGRIIVHIDNRTDAFWNGDLVRETGTSFQLQQFRIHRETAQLRTTDALTIDQLVAGNFSYGRHGFRSTVIPFILPALTMFPGFSIDALVGNGSTSFTENGDRIVVLLEGRTMYRGYDALNLTVGSNLDRLRRGRALVSVTYPHPVLLYRDISFNETIRLVSVGQGPFDVEERYSDRVNLGAEG